jgi:hypothetical protein
MIDWNDFQRIDLLHALEDLERYAQSLEDNEVALANIRETRTGLQKLVKKMDALESGFDKIAERSRTSLMSLSFMIVTELTVRPSALVITAGSITAALWVGCLRLEGQPS